MHAIHIGTSGWSYDDWRGPFYPPGTAQGDYLTTYAEQFDTVEVDSTFYRIPSRRMVQGWADKTPAEFRFALKMVRSVTHERVLVDCEADVETLMANLEPLQEKLRCVLLQFGYFNRKAFASSEPFFERLETFLDAYADQLPLACEIRNRNWLGARYFDLLRRHNVAACLVEHAWLPPLNELVEAHDVVTGPFSYFRLIGDRKGIEEITETWDEVVVDRARDLDRVAEALRRIATRAEILVYINNHYAGHGPQSCRELAARL